MVDKDTRETQDDSAAGTGLYELVTELRNRCGQREDEIRAKAGLTPGAYQCLVAMAQGEELTGREVARRIRVSPSRASRIVDALVRAGYVKRRDGPTDRRVTLVSLTKEGALLRKRVSEIHAECEAELVAAFDDQELRSLKTGIKRLIGAF